MIIGVDVDGVLTDLYAFLSDAYEKYAKMKNNSISINLKGKNSKEMFGWSKEEDDEFWNKNIFEYGQNVKQKAGASETLKKLKEQGHEIYIITARQYCTCQNENGENSRRILAKWLSDNDITYDKIFYSEEGKGKVPNLKNNNVDVLIDDYIHNLKDAIEAGLSVICMDEPYNRGFESEMMIRCKNWNEVFDAIEKMSKEV